MTAQPLTDDDRALVDAARSVLRDHYHPKRHTTGAALRTADGTIYEGVSVKGGTAKADLHAEPLALARAMMDGHRAFDAVAAVQPATDVDDPADGTRIVSACGVCRELLVAHAPDLWIVLPADDEGDPSDAPRKRRLSDLLPD